MKEIKMDKINEVSIYFLERGWYGQIDRQRSDETDLINFGNLDIRTFKIEMEIVKETKKVKLRDLTEEQFEKWKRN